VTTVTGARVTRICCKTPASAKPIMTTAQAKKQIDDKRPRASRLRLVKIAPGPLTPFLDTIAGLRQKTACSSPFRFAPILLGFALHRWRYLGDLTKYDRAAAAPIIS
jgi:hypothetical protein